MKLGRLHERDAFRLRVSRFVTAYTRLSAQMAGRIESVDMRYPNGLAYRMRGQPGSSHSETLQPDAV